MAASWLCTDAERFVTMRAAAFLLALCLGVDAFQLQSVSRAPSATRLGAGFGTEVRKAKKGGKKGGKSRGTAGLTTDNGWVPLIELEAPLIVGEPKAVGRSISGKPYLVRRLESTGAVAATSCECGKCEYPLLKSPTKIAEDGTEELICEMCGCAYDIETGTERPSTGGGNALLAPILRNKPQKPLKVFPAREVDDGRVFVNITPITPK